MENKITICQQFKAPDDQSGNPARLWVGYDDQGQVIQVWDRAKWPEELVLLRVRQDFPILEIPPVNITRGEYKRLKRMAAENNILVIQS